MRSDNKSVLLKQPRFWASAHTWSLIGGTAFFNWWDQHRPN